MLPIGTTAERISELNRAIGTVLEQLNRKAPVFLRRLLSLVHYGAEEEIRTPDPLLGKEMLYH